MNSSLPSAAAALLLCACGASRVTPDAQGTDVGAGPCGRGLVVIESDYQSSNASLLGFDGAVLSPSLISSSAQAGGFTETLTGDAEPPFSPQTGAEVVVIDSYPAGVLHFIDLATARLRADLSVGTGFASNPHDYLALSEHKAYVARYDSNPNPGAQAWDAGGDVLLLDPALPAITGRIDLTPAMAGEPAQFTPNPAHLVQVGGRVFVLLASYSSDWMSASASRLVEIDPATDSILSTLVLSGLHGCDALAIAPDQTELAIACTGDDLGSSSPRIDTSGVALLDISGTPKLTARFAAATFGANPLGFAIDYAAQGVLFLGTLGHFAASGAVAAAQDSLVRFDIASGSASEVLQSDGQPFTLGDVRCVSACGACFATDALRSGGSVLRFAVAAGGVLGTPQAVRAETRVGLPPRYLGEF